MLFRLFISRDEAIHEYLVCMDDGRRREWVLCKFTFKRATMVHTACKVSIILILCWNKSVNVNVDIRIAAKRDLNFKISPNGIGVLQYLVGYYWFFWVRKKKSFTLKCEWNMKPVNFSISIRNWNSKPLRQHNFWQKILLKRNVLAFWQIEQSVKK